MANVRVVTADAYTTTATATAVVVVNAVVKFVRMRFLGNHLLLPASTDLMNPFIFKGFLRFN
jgi:hypothetical protein